MSSDEIVALREQIEFLERTLADNRISRVAALAVLKRHDLLMEHAAEVLDLKEAYDLQEAGSATNAIVYEQSRPFRYYPGVYFEGGVVRDCSSYELGETTWNDPLTGTHTGLRCLERHPEHPSMQCMKPRDHQNVIRTTEPPIHYYCFGSAQSTIHWTAKDNEGAA